MHDIQDMCKTITHAVNAYSFKYFKMNVLRNKINI